MRYCVAPLTTIWQRALPMRSKSLELPPDVARRILEDMRAFFAERNGIKRDEIAARQLHVLRGYQRSGEKRLRLFDVKEMLLQMRDSRPGSIKS